jgi:hypothetical protein
MLSKYTGTMDILQGFIVSLTYVVYAPAKNAAGGETTRDD